MNPGSRFVPFVLVTFCAASAAIAGQTATSQTPRTVDPIVGTWKLNLAQSKPDPVTAAAYPMPKQQTETYRVVAGERIQLTLSRIAADGLASSSTLSWPAAGGIVQNDGPAPAGFSLVETLIAPGEWYVTYLQEGRQLITMHKVISPDGKRMTQTLRGRNGQGGSFESVQVFDREK